MPGILVQEGMWLRQTAFTQPSSRNTYLDHQPMASYQGHRIHETHFTPSRTSEEQGRRK